MKAGLRQRAKRRRGRGYLIDRCKTGCQQGQVMRGRIGAEPKLADRVLITALSRRIVLSERIRLSWERRNLLCLRFWNLG